MENIVRTNETITICRFNHPKCVSDFLIQLKSAIKEGYQNIVIESKTVGVFPNACVPIAGIIQHYIEEGTSISFNLQRESYLSKCGFTSPYIADRNRIKNELYPFDKIYRYETSGQVSDITQAFVDSISHQSVCERGVLGGLSWCLNEVMDNVLLHSNSKYGLVMAQYHPSTKHVAFCVFDSGVGIYETLKSSPHKPRSELDALSMAIQEGVGDGKGQGNGLHGLYQIVEINQGRLCITSGASSIKLYEKGELQKYQNIQYISQSNRGTVVDFQLDLNKQINLKQVLYSIGGIDDFDYRLDNMLDKDDWLRYDVYNDGHGTATREAGEFLRNDIINSIRRTNTGVILDFSNVRAVSSSFVDELISKLVIDLGFIGFHSLVKLIGINEDLAFLCERSVYMRIYETWKNNTSK